MMFMTKDRRIQKKLLSDRLCLELIGTEDYDFIIALVNSKGWMENIGDRNIHSKFDAVAYINKIRQTENFYYWVVRLRNTNVPAGIISILKRSYLEYFDIGFAFLPEFGRQGYAYEAATTVLRMVSGQPEFNVVLATTLYSNKSSIKLLLKLGFRFDKEIEIENELPVENTKLHIYTNAPG
jgi:[ribosomal protein S5]-alanine N-acetyltransferase